MIKKLLVVFVTALVFTGLHSPVFAEDHGEPPVKDLEQQFKNVLMVETEEDGEVTKYDSMDEVEQELDAFMTKPLMDHYSEMYFMEENDKLYKKSLGYPIFVETDKDYELEKVSENKYKLTQEGSSQTHGDYTFEVTYSYEAGKWVFSKRSATQNENGGEMPDTATPAPMIMLAGAGIMLLGALALFTRRRTV
ncbi:LPXTG cell wall anchor domain-containing protein [Halobacillus yeomjeoni]|uniref:LPXTG cell wall anchor domain-containing protein n=1 Tax=Halobacillus yeomjeoni TaxID=311194 RepID=A0A931HX30_9BACI|nr:LPXTG cell wall anchor domain-containing protein [Halobacillus yeomjeoni]MBH0231154.1 LPXTG cell wall anchor domain-containing protein [Halobacillus yeomjeoni]